MAKSEKKLEASKLRREGKSIKEIAKILKISRSSASVWVRDISLTEDQIEALRRNQIARGHAGRIVGAEMNRIKKLERIRAAEEEAIKEIQSLSVQELFFLGLGLYWGEGSKSQTHPKVTMTNSDPKIILLSIRWFTECLGISKERFHPRIYISDSHWDRAETLLEFWATKLSIPKEQFRKTIFLSKGKKIYENRDTYYGVMALQITKSGDLRHKILALIERVGTI